MAKAVPATFCDLTDCDVSVKIVDIGANPIDGTPPYASLLESGRAEVVGFEPNPDALARLEAAKSQYETYLPYAIGDGSSHTLRMCAAPGMTSLLEPNRAVLELFHGFPNWGRVIGTTEVDTKRLDDIPMTHGVDLLKLDIQGGELMALRNATDRLAGAVVVHTEVEFLELYEGQPLFGDVDSFLRQHGFVLHRFYPATVSRTLQPMIVNNDIYAGMSQLVWSDAVFVRDFTKLDRMSDAQLMKAAMILHDCYMSYDLVMRFLLELDRRHKSQKAALYLERLTSAPVVALVA